MKRPYKRCIFDELGDPCSETVLEAMERTCEHCGARPGSECTQVENGFPLDNRRVHYVRTKPQPEEK